MKPALWYLVAVTVFLSCLGGGVFPRTVCMAGVVGLIVLALCLARAGKDASQNASGSSTRPVLPAVPGLALLGLVLLLLSIVPLPASLDRVMGSARRTQHATVRAALTRAQETGVVEEPMHGGFCLTRNRAGTLRTIQLALLALTAALLASRLSPRQKLNYLRFLALWGVLIAIGGYLSQWHFPREKTVWWLIPVSHGRAPVGPFVSRSHFGGFLAMLAPICVALFGHSAKGRRYVGCAMWGLALAVISAAVFASLSRGAMIALVLALGTLLFTALWQRRRAHTLLLLCVLAVSLATAAGALFPVSGGVPRAVRNRLGTLWAPLDTDSAQARLSTWRDTLTLWRHYPILGVGANGFRMVFPQHRTATTRKAFFHTENEYLEVLADAGAVGAALCGALALAVALSWRAGVMRGACNPVCVTAVLGATVAAFVHAGVDFAPHTPLYSTVYASLLGLGLGSPGAPALSLAAIPFVRRLPPALLAATTAAALALSLMTGGDTPYRQDSPDLIKTADSRDVCKALRSAPTNWYAWFHLADRAIRLGTIDSYAFGEACMTQAAFYDPNNYRLWKILGATRRSMGDTPGADEAFGRMKQLRSWEKIPKDQGRGTY